MKRTSTVSKPKGIKVVLHSQKSEPLPVRSESAGWVLCDTCQNVKEEEEYGCRYHYCAMHHFGDMGDTRDPTFARSKECGDYKSNENNELPIKLTGDE